MSARIENYYALAPDAFKALMALEATFKTGSLDYELRELVKMRASQINGCAFCLHMHASESRAHGVAEMRLHLLPAWRESSLYSARERAALAWTESLTRVADTGAPDADYAEIEHHFSPAERVQLTVLISAINAWNRIAVGMRAAHPKTGVPTPHAA